MFLHDYVTVALLIARKTEVKYVIKMQYTKALDTHFPNFHNTIYILIATILLNFSA